MTDGLDTEIHEERRTRVADDVDDERVPLDEHAEAQLSQRLGAVASSTTSDEYRKLMQQESVKWAAVLKKGKITLE